MKEMTLQEIQNILGYEVKIVADKPLRQLSDVPAGETFKIGGMEFIVLEHNCHGTEVILKDFWKTAKFDSNSNHYACSEIRKELTGEFYKKLTALVGANNILLHEVDLTSDDGRDDYGKVMDFVSLLTCDMYRKYVRILDKYRPKSWWWLATPYSTKGNGYEYAVRFVYGDGALDGDGCRYGYGVRPFVRFASSIFVS